MMFEERKERGQVGIGTLIVFIAMVLVAAIAAGVLINTAGFLQSQSEETGQESSEQVTDRLQVLQASGIVTTNDGSNEIGGFELLTSKAPGAEDIDLEGVTMQWIDDTGTYDVVHDNVYDSQDGAFDHTSVKDTDGSLDDASSAPVVNDPDDRAKLVIDIGADDSGDDFSSYYDNTADPSFRSSALSESASAELRLTTHSGATETVRLTVPQSLSGKSAATL